MPIRRPTRTKPTRADEAKLLRAFDDAVSDLQRVRFESDQRHRVDEVEMIVELVAYRGAKYADIAGWFERTRESVSKRVRPVMAERGLKPGRDTNNPNPDDPECGRPYRDWTTAEIVTELLDNRAVVLGLQAETRPAMREKVVPAVIAIQEAFPEWSTYRLAERAQADGWPPMLSTLTAAMQDARGPRWEAARRVAAGLPPVGQPEAAFQSAPSRRA